MHAEPSGVIADQINSPSRSIRGASSDIRTAGASTGPPGNLTRHPP